MTELADFLSRNVEGYLFEDLRTMCAAKPSAPDASAGAVGYPLVMTAFSGMELLGALVSQTEFQKHGQGDVYFADYWQNHLYAKDVNRRHAGPILYRLIRHGLAHSFLAKGAITICKHDAKWHLVRDRNGVVYVDAARLAEDFISSYTTGIKSWMSSGTNAQQQVRSMEQRFDEMKTAYAKQGAELSSVLLPSPDPLVIHVGPSGLTTASAVISFGSNLPLPPTGATSKGISTK